MVQALLTVVGTWLYVVVVAVLAPHVGHAGLGFLLGYFIVATVDLWRCWYVAPIERTKPTALELAYASLILFPIGSLLWLPWDTVRLLRTLDPLPRR